MLRTEIEHSATLRAINNYGITDEMLEQIENIDVLRLLIKNLSRRKWQQEHKDYYKQRYVLVKKGEYEVGQVEYDKTPKVEEPKERPERTPEYIRQYNREYYHKKRKQKKIPEQKCCEKCKCELSKELDTILEKM